MNATGTQILFFFHVCNSIVPSICPTNICVYLSVAVTYGNEQNVASNHRTLIK